MAGRAGRATLTALLSWARGVHTRSRATSPAAEGERGERGKDIRELREMKLEVAS